MTDPDISEEAVALLLRQYEVCSADYVHMTAPERIRAIRARVTELEAALATAEAETARAVLAERERAAKVCEDRMKVFGSDEYATGQPFSSFGERFACGSCAAAIRARSEGDHPQATDGGDGMSEPQYDPPEAKILDVLAKTGSDPRKLAIAYLRAQKRARGDGNMGGVCDRE